MALNLKPQAEHAQVYDAKVQAYMEARSTPPCTTITFSFFSFAFFQYPKKKQTNQNMKISMDISLGMDDRDISLPVIWIGRIGLQILKQISLHYV